MFDEKILIILIGAPGAGKGVTGQILKEQYGFKHLSVGEFLRHKSLDKTSQESLYINEISSGINLIPDHIVNGIVEKFLRDNINAPKILDGYPKNENQCYFLCNLIKLLHLIPKFFYFSIDDELQIERLRSRETCVKCSHDYIFENIKKPGYCNLCGGHLYKRSSDSLNNVKLRNEFFKTFVSKILRTIQKNYVVHSINGNQKIQNIYKDVLRYVLQ